MENEKLSPSQYFELVKDKKNKIDDKELEAYYKACLNLIQKYRITNQTKALRKLIFHVDCTEKERELVKAGIDTYVFRDDVEEFIENIADDVVKIIELENYEREIPDDIIDVVGRVGHYFDKMYVVFTDYTGKAEREVEQARRDKDPILFGTFQDERNSIIIERFYYLGDWEDEYCDLTLDKMVSATLKQTGKSIERAIVTPATLDEIREELKQSDPNRFSVALPAHRQPTNKHGLFGNVRTFMTRVFKR